MQFTKMHGAGNDYVYVDCFRQPAPDAPAELARALSDRHRGIGGDGLILICPSDIADASMRMFNADGSQAEMCGNGIRCLAKYVYEHGICRQTSMTVETGRGVLTLELALDGSRVSQVRVDMGEPLLAATQIPTRLPGDPVVNVPMAVDGKSFRVTCVSMGNPHCVTYVDDATDELVLGIGPKVEVSPHFPDRTNVEFVEVLSRKEVRQRTWERGSGETQACGTGASAVCVAGVLTGRTDRQLTVHLPGGDLALEWNEADNHVYMTGPAVEVFAGEWPTSGPQ
jgi:diaminopimelate epimerase